ncbi:MAG: Rieske 2Fe-2S domain-containing protein [Sphingomonadales bacterium]|nr:Rieske 2Fe-2S domain-containing protein [Sphingomonadales bacterium]
MATAATLPPAIDYRHLVQDGRLHGSLYTDPEIFAQEMEAIFHRGWSFVAHDSEVPNNGDFVVRKVGTQSLIVVRDSKGEIRIHYNRCSHRGAVLCQTSSGHRSRLTCPYHAWTFALDGRLIGVPDEEAYPAGFSKADAGLAPVARVDSYGGFIFVNLVPNGYSLRDHLGKATDLIDGLLGLSPVGRIQLNAGWMKHKMRSNWKIIVENQVDGYHAQMVHGSLLKANQTFATVRDRKPTSPTRVQDFGMGHTDIDHTSDYLKANDRLFRWTGGIDPARLPNYVKAMQDAYGEEDARRRLIGGPPHSMLFPNLSLAEMNIMVIEPVSPTASIQYTCPVFLEGADELNARTLRRCEGALGPAGFLIADDAEIGELTQMGVANLEPEWINLSRGMDTEEVLPNGVKRAGLMDETSQRGFWRHYREVMSASDHAMGRENG